MRNWKLLRNVLGGAAAVLVAFGTPAAAAPDAQGMVTFESVTCESLNLGGLCTGPLYTAFGHYKVYSDVNPDNPMPSANNWTYVYEVANDAGSYPQAGSLRRFDLETPSSATVDAGFLDAAGVEPNDVQIDPTVVRFVFEQDFIDPNEGSEQLYVISAFGPGAENETPSAVGSAFAIDTPKTTVGPLTAPPAVPCTIGFSGSLANGEEGTLQYFPGAEFDAVLAEAVAISTVFATEEELLAALDRQSGRDIESRARRQLAALLLDVAAGNLYSSNTRCRLFAGDNGTEIDIDDDGVADMTLGEALALIESWILSGDRGLIAQAHTLADDINNGVGVLNLGSYDD